ncbi:hypothetical protein H0H92_009486 [Tricholoma furcatifolium]|nr:hypothetical protein H0H92_009486 [Tricholoma furcatifolium]
MTESRNAVVKTALTRRFNTSNAINAFRAGQRDRSVSRPVQEAIDQEVLVYSAAIGIGNPPTTHHVIRNEKPPSSNTWIGALTPYIPTNTSFKTDNGVSVGYGGGLFQGWEYLDRVKLADNLVLINQSIGVANDSEISGSFDSLDGILGLGPTDLTLSTLSPSSNSTVPTVLDTAVDEGLIPAKIFGVFFQPTTQPNLPNGGEITWGGPITTASPETQFWGIDADVTYGRDLRLLNSTAGIVDTGSPLIYLNTDAFNSYVAATGAVLDPTLNFLTINSTQAKSLQPLIFNINGVPFELTPNAQSWPHSLNSVFGGDSNSTYLLVGDAGQLGFILGYTFLERYYSVFDADNRRVGLAPTAFTKAIID